MTILDTIAASPKVDPPIRRNRDPHSGDSQKSFDAAMASAASDDDSSRQIGGRHDRATNGATSEPQTERVDNPGPGAGKVVDEHHIDEKAVQEAGENADQNTGESADQNSGEHHGQAAALAPVLVAEAPTETAVSADLPPETPVDGGEAGTTVAPPEAGASADLPPETPVDATAAPAEGASPDQSVSTANAAATASAVRTTMSTSSEAAPVVPVDESADGGATAAAMTVTAGPSSESSGERPPGGAPDRGRVAIPSTGAAVATVVDASAVDAASIEPRTGEPTPLPTGSTTSSPAPDARLSQQLATRELFQRIEQHRRSLDGSIEMELVTERFGSLRIEAIDGRDGVHLSLKSDSNDQRALAELAQELRQEFDQSDVDLAGFDVGGRGDSEGDAPTGERHLDETTTESVSAHPRLAGTAGGLDLRL